MMTRSLSAPFYVIYCLCIVSTSSNYVNGQKEQTANAVKDMVNSEKVKEQLLGFFLCQNETNTEIDENRSVGCKTDFDGWGCWQASKIGQVVSIPCPSLVNYGRPAMNDFATRLCTSSGTWADADYVKCSRISEAKPDVIYMMQELQFIQKVLTEEYKTPQLRQAYKKCLLDVLLQPASSLQGSYCPRNFDGWGCWNDTAAGSTVYIQCPAFVYGFSDKQKAHKVCQNNGEWFRHPLTNNTWSNYTTCVDEDDLKFRRAINSIYIGGYSVSLMALCISLFIFSYFRTRSFSELEKK